MTTRILIPLDGSELAHKVLPFVHALAGDEPYELDLVRVVTREELDDLTEGEANALARGHLSRVAQLLAERDVKARTAVLEGDPAEEILGHAEDVKPDLIAIASHGRSGVARWIRGSVAERLIRASPYPVLVASTFGVAGGAPWTMERGSRELALETGIRKILVPLDGSERANGVLPLVARIAKRHGSEVHLLHVARRGTEGKPASAFEPAFAALEGIDARLRIIEGHPADTILSVTADELFDLVALTAHGTSGESPWPLGATAEHVARHCSAPLLVQRTPPPRRAKKQS